ncbi:MAG: YfhO family protein, partial [Bryobacterales bacterium]|nr:YfhO family protein [Bryobacterales bacterium]
EVSLVRRNSGRVTIEADMACRGMVILGDSYFPGWVARVDGVRTPILEAYTAIRGVVVDKGKHTIDMRYLPASVIAGLILTLLGLGGALGLTILARRREAEAGVQSYGGPAEPPSNSPEGLPHRERPEA